MLWTPSVLRVALWGTGLQRYTGVNVGHGLSLAHRIGGRGSVLASQDRKRLTADPFIRLEAGAEAPCLHGYGGAAASAGPYMDWTARRRAPDLTWLRRRGDERRTLRGVQTSRSHP